jgi:hypothetical protein
MVSGPSTVIQAIASARDAVKSISSRLGTTRPEERQNITGPDFTESWFEDIPRAEIRELSPSERLKGIQMEDIPSIAMTDAEREAHRCFNCGCLAVEPSDIAVALVTLGATIVTTKRTVAAQDFFHASAICSTVLEANEVIKEIRIPKPADGSVQKYEKFTLRKPIDFAVVSVASLVTTIDGVCKDARIVLGAVAPEPLQARATEEFMKGKRIDEETAVEAARLALEDAKPLSGNGYKVTIAKTLVKRSILNGTAHEQ